MKPSSLAVALLLSAVGPLTGHAASSEADSTVHLGFDAFRRGTLGDGGANTYVSAQGRIETSHRWDLNSTARST